MNDPFSSRINCLTTVKSACILTLFIGMSLLLNPQNACAQWTELGGLDALGTKTRIHTVCSDRSNNIYTAGTFSHGFNINYYVAKFNGSAWSELGGTNSLAANGYINSLCSDPAGNIYAAGDFINSSGNYYVAKYNGAAWSELGGLNGLAANGSILSICSDPAGNIYAAGIFSNNSAKFYVAKFNGSTWTELGGVSTLAANQGIHTIYSDTAGKIYAGGDFTNASGNSYIAMYNGTAWTELGGVNSFNANGDIINGPINSICGDPAGNIYAAGSIQDTTGMACIAQYKNGGWKVLGGAGSLVSGLRGSVLSICSDSLGNIYAGGGFTNTNAAGKHYQYVSQYNGTAWSELGGLNALKANETIYSVCSDHAGNIYGTGSFTNVNRSTYVARYGPAVSLGLSNPGSSYDYAIALYPNPATTQICVSVASELIGTSYKVYDNTGRIILSGKLKSERSLLDIRHIPSGIYTLSVGSGSRQAIQFIKRQ